MLIAALTTTTWENLSDGASLVIVALIIVAGVLLGYALRGLVGKWQAESIEKKTKLRAEEAETEIKARLKEADISARAAVVKAKEEFEKAMQSRRAEQSAIEERLARREEALDRKASALETREAKVSAREVAAKEAADQASAAKAEADSRLASLARMTHAEALREAMRSAHAELRDDAESLSRRIQEAAKERGEDKARAIVAEAVQRCAVAHVNELATSTVDLPAANLKGRIIGRDGRNVRAFESATGVTLLLDDAPDVVVLSAFDPQRREIARRALEALVADGRIHPASIEEAVASARVAVEQGNAEAGAEAAAEAGVPGLSAETLQLMGELRFRTSFAQNVLRHSVEVALLSGVIASELGADSAKARRAGFLHDIGKAFTAEQKGSHAELGANFLKTHGEDAAIVAAVAAHHGESESDGGVLGLVISAADAISSARPGARQETAANYVVRISEIEKLACSYDGVKSAMAVQAGRDLRVFVDPAVVTDDLSAELARQLCRAISTQLKFPGQIRVTVIRELRCTEYAR